MSAAKPIFEVTTNGNAYQVLSMNNKDIEIQGATWNKFQPHCEDTEGFLISAKDELIVTCGKSDKIIKFWRISSLLSSTEAPSPFHQWKHAKRITALHLIDFKIETKDISGIIYSDKFGEVRFFNLVNLPSKSDEESKENTVKNGNEERENNANLWFGHQHIITHLELAKDKKYIFTVDGVKVKITHFPEILCVHSVVFHNFKKVTNFLVIDSSHFLVYSDQEKSIKIWKINEETSNLSKEYSTEDLQILLGEELTEDDKIYLAKVDEENMVSGSLNRGTTTKEIAFKINVE